MLTFVHNQSRTIPVQHNKSHSSMLQNWTLTSGIWPEQDTLMGDKLNWTIRDIRSHSKERWENIQEVSTAKPLRVSFVTPSTAAPQGHMTNTRTACFNIATQGWDKGQRWQVAKGNITLLRSKQSSAIYPASTETRGDRLCVCICQRE